MKNKRLVALIAGIVCLVILAAALFWSLTRSVGKKTDPVDQENNSQTGNQEAEQPEEVKENEPAEEEPSQQPSGNTEEISSADQLNSNPKTKAEIEAVLN